MTPLSSHLLHQNDTEVLIFDIPSLFMRLLSFSNCFSLETKLLFNGIEATGVVLVSDVLATSKNERVEGASDAR